MVFRSRWPRRWAAAAVLLTSASGVHSQSLGCSWESVAAQYGVNPYVLYSIAHRESRLNPGAIRRNKDGSTDYGLMQINSLWLPQLRRYGIQQHHLMDTCTNLHVGAYILADRINRFGNTWQAIGSYHSTTPARRDRYAAAIAKHLASINAR